MARIFLAGLAIAVLVLLPIAHAAGIAIRSRSAWLAADLVLLAVTAGAVTWTARLLLAEAAPAAASRGLIALGVLLLAALTGAGFAALAAGRTDIRAAHAALSRVLWPAALAAAALFAVYAKWAVSITPGDLAWIWLSPSPRGDWTALSGRAASRGEDDALFLFKTSTGRFVKVRSGEARPAILRGRPRGRLARSEAAAFPFSLSCRGPSRLGISRPARFYRVAPLESSAEPVATDVLLSSMPRAWTVSADGARVAAVNDDADVTSSTSKVSVYDLSTGRLLAAAALPPNIGARLVFIALDRLRIYLEEPSGSASAGQARRRLGIHEMDVAGKTLAETGEMGPFEGFLVLRTNPAASRAIAIDPRGGRMTLHDGRSGRQIAILSSGERRSRNAAFLGDGRIAEVESNGAGARLRVFSPEGEEQKMVSLRTGDGWRIALGGETAPGVVLVALRSVTASGWRDSECLLVDTRTGETRLAGKRIFPAAAMAWWGRDDPSWYPAAGSEATRLFLDTRGSLLRLDPVTGARRVILAGVPGGGRWKVEGGREGPRPYVILRSVATKNLLRLPQSPIANHQSQTFSTRADPSLRSG